MLDISPLRNRDAPHRGAHQRQAASSPLDQLTHGDTHVLHLPPLSPPRPLRLPLVRVEDAVRRHSPITEEVRKAAQRRVNRFLERTTAPLLLQSVSWGTDPVKEITESEACWEAVMQWIVTSGRRQSDPSVSVLVVGDGRSPRTGALIACLSKWTVTSVDPGAAKEGPHPTIQRLSVVKARLEDRPDLRADVVVAPHSHASPEATRAACLPGGVVVALPCCVPWAPLPHTRVYVDHACLSPDRTVLVEAM